MNTERHPRVLGFPPSIFTGLFILVFEVELIRRGRRHVSCSFQLSNKTKNRVAFMVINPNPLVYGCEPDVGIVLPRSACDLTVTMQLAMENDPPDMQSKDEFMIQTLFVSSAVTVEDIEQLFDKEGHRSHNGVIGADYFFPPDVGAPDCPDGLVEEHEERNGNTQGELTLYIFIALLLVIFLCIAGKALLFIWSSTFVILMLMIKLLSSLVSDAIREWILGILRDIFLDPLYRRLRNIALQ